MPGSDEQGEVRLPHGGVVVDVDDDDLRAALLSRPDRVGHHVDLRVDRVRAPDHDAVGDTHLARIGARELARAGNPAGPRHVGADRRELARVSLGVAEPIDAVPHHEAHGAGVVVRPHRLRSDRPFGRQEGLGGEVEGLVPGDTPELARALRPDPPQRVRQPIRMMDPLGVARDLGADDAGRVAVVLRPMDAPDGAPVDHLDIEGAGRGAVMRAGRVPAFDARRRVHAPVMPQRKPGGNPLSFPGSPNGSMTGSGESSEPDEHLRRR